ncbi:hypothetical protein BY458DRAFT_511170 [Sporodiniella umbellata]|nr:hypothetical protein BY458DRAFT_511170 [Sporodiniella umbellata]
MKPSPEHPGNPKWQTFTDWKKEREPSNIKVIKSEQETMQEQFKRFNLVQDASGWGDASEAQDAGWGLNNQSPNNGW